MDCGTPVQGPGNQQHMIWMSVSGYYTLSHPGATVSYTIGADTVRQHHSCLPQCEGAPHDLHQFGGRTMVIVIIIFIILHTPLGISNGLPQQTNQKMQI